MRSLGLLLLLMIPAAAEGGEPRSSAACEAWIRSIGPYERTMDAILGGEVDRVVRDLRRAIDAHVVEGDPARLEALEARVRNILEMTRTVDPPRELRRLHDRLDALHVSIVWGAHGVLQGGAAAASPVLETCVRDLVRYYEQLLTDLLENGCENGDTVALEHDVLPRLRAGLAELEAADSTR